MLATNPSQFPAISTGRHPKIDISHTGRQGQLPKNRNKATKRAKRSTIRRKYLILFFSNSIESIEIMLAKSFPYTSAKKNLVIGDIPNI